MFLPLYVILLLWSKYPEHAGDSTLVGPLPRPVAQTSQVIVPEARLTFRGPAPQPTPWPGQSSFFSAYAGGAISKNEGAVQIRCKTGRPLNNLNSRIIVEGVLQEDVVSSSGKILVPAGSKVVGQGFCDPDRSRILARGKWTFYAVDHQISCQGILIDSAKAEGLKGKETGSGMDEEKIKQAVYRDGMYLYVPEGTDFTLRLSGSISVQDLGSASEQ